MVERSQLKRLFSGPRSPRRSFDVEGAVGLGIVAAMKDGEPAARARPAAKSEPIAIVVHGGGKRSMDQGEDEAIGELSESYTCVIAHVGPGSARKTVYMDGIAADGWVVFETPPPWRPWPLPPAEDFLSRCFRCEKTLQGNDVFMYRGEKAFCSAECRCQQMVSEEQRETKPFDCFMSPCSAATPVFFAAGLAVA
ncbi:FCS-Like Zinc finger 14-like [Wolffia australiana]